MTQKTRQPTRTFLVSLASAVIVDKFEEPAGDSKLLRLYCSIVVDRESQKPIVIGKGGAMIKQIGTAARLELERFLGTRVYLDLHVKVKSEWRDDERVLDEMGMEQGKGQRPKGKGTVGL